MFLVATPLNNPSSHYQMYHPHRPSSPLNPNSGSASTTHMGSSSPLTSPLAGPSTGLPMTPSPFALHPSSPLSKRPRPTPSPGSASAGSSVFTTRYQRPSPRSRHSFPTDSTGRGGDLFTTEGTTPVEGAMWKERFSRRMEERERRKKAREADLNRRRSMSAGAGAGSSSPSGMSVEEEEEADRRAQEDDEEIFRRLVILQRRRAEHAALASLERETGGSDPLLPEFWEEEEHIMQAEERALLLHFDEDMVTSSPLRPGLYHTPIRGTFGYAGGSLPAPIEEGEEDLWAIEAAQAEEAEREAEDAEVAQRMEEQYLRTLQREGEDVDWEALDAMAMDID